MRFRSLALLAVAVSISACDSSVDEPPPPTPVVPLAVGAGWALQEAYVVRYDDAGAPGDTLDQRAFGRVHTVAVDRDSTVEGETWYRLRASRGLLHCVFEDGVWLANRADGLYRFRGSVEDAERVYATGLGAGDAFIETTELLAVLEDGDARYDLGGSPVAARRYLRTWRGADAFWGRGPISPSVPTRDHLSPERGLVALEVALVREGAAEDTFVPTSYGYELVAASSQAAPVRDDGLAGRPLGVVGAEPRD